MSFRELTNEQARQLIDLEQVYETHVSANREMQSRFAGSMQWKTVKEQDYLYRRTKGVSKTIGPRSPETLSIFEAFQSGRERIEDTIRGTREKLAAMAPVNRGLRLGRVPKLTARILRELDEAGLLGRHIRIVGTACLYAYEAAAGVHIPSSLLATSDVDLLYDARGQLKLAVTDFKAEGVIGLLRRIDRSFQPLSKHGFRAANRDGFLVDLITPFESKDRTRPRKTSPRLSDADDDLTAIEIDGLAWLRSCPAFERMTVGEDGLPVPMVCPDPRAFAMHKMWLAEREDREPLKKPRDRGQAQITIKLVKERMPYLGGFNDPALTAVPAALLGAIEGIAATLS